MFGGSGTGIPNNSVAAAKKFVNGANTVTIAMNATQRFSNPPLTNNGAGVFFAGTGSNFGGAGESTTEGALWNWNFYMNVDGPGVLADYQFDLYYDFDPAAGNTLADLGRIDITASLLCGVPCGADPSATLVQDSQNLLFGFLATSLIITFRHYRLALGYRAGAMELRRQVAALHEELARLHNRGIPSGATCLAGAVDHLRTLVHRRARAPIQDHPGPDGGQTKPPARLRASRKSGRLRAA